MELTLEQRKVKKLYIEGKTAKQIAKETGINISNIYRWIKDPKMEFKKSKELAEFTTDDMVEMIDESHKKLLIEVLSDPNKLLDSKTADSLCKVINILEKMSAKSTREKAGLLEGDTDKSWGVLLIDDIEHKYLVEQGEKETIKSDNF